MAISRAVQKDVWVYVYNMNNQQIFAKNGTLQGYTSGSVSIRRDDWIYTYDENGTQIACDYSK